jgi:hypothetical protein
MKTESCLPGKTSLVLRDETEHQRTGGEAVSVDNDPLTARLQILIFGVVLEDVAASVVFDHHFALGPLYAAKEPRQGQGNQQEQLCESHRHAPSSGKK